ncbi:TIR domain-containing protein [Snodgrassella sp. B3882]|uniref:TIR domain-containing protein n=1 Tax=Snodgrassella sp. B3882 TaxID=2818037 RepID=UPI00226A9CF8|nr:TIR domain-containing protein [Snodgrassella sp. B3882]MCX8743898.1 TIR domain-containing protein [Snodgrassella sp. B3882]
MSKKIFISYKYGDTQVARLNSLYSWELTKVRDYVDLLQKQLEKQGDHINKGENDNESLAHFKDETIQSRLADKIYDSTVTIVLVSKGMNELWCSEKDQWIPWEIAYSLRTKTRFDRTSKTNAIFAIKLPDENNSYDYDPKLFNIIKNNMNNRNYSYPSDYQSDLLNSYIFYVRWDCFIKNINYHIDLSLEIWRNRDKYVISKSI